MAHVSPKEIVAFMDQILRFFAGQGLNGGVCCNTMTAYGYQRARGALPDILWCR